MKRIFWILATLMVFVLAACGETAGETANNHDEATAQIEEKQEIASEEKIEEDPASEEEIEDTKKPISTELEELKVHYIDVGQADATLIEFNDGVDEYHILYDAGDWRGNEVVDYLSAQNIQTIDLVIISHPDADHIGQLDKVIGAFDVGEVWMSGNESSSQTFQRALEAILASDADYYEPRAGEHFSIGPLEIDVLYPESISGKSNEESISAMFTYGAVKFLFTGDAGTSGETYMRNQFDVDADVLHLGHHGSNTSSDPAFIDAVSPEVAIYSAGANNSYGHPSPEVVNTVLDRNIELYGTDTNGTILITTNGVSIDSIQTDQSSSIITTPPQQSTTNTSTKEEQTEPRSSGECININEASIQEIQEIIHIGAVRAEDLIELRPYNSVDDLERIKGIGPARIAEMKQEGKACVQ